MRLQVIPLLTGLLVLPFSTAVLAAETAAAYTSYCAGQAAIAVENARLFQSTDQALAARVDELSALEVITRDPLKVPCLTEKYWATLADVPGTDLARTLRIVRAHSQKTLPRVSELPSSERAEFEEQNIRQSLAYAHSELGL